MASGVLRTDGTIDRERLKQLVHHIIPTHGGVASMADRRELTADQRNLICRIIRDSEIVSGLVGKQEAITAAVADTGWSEDEIRQMIEDGIASSRKSD